MQPLSHLSDKHIAAGTRQKWGEHRGVVNQSFLDRTALVFGGKFGRLLHKITIQV